MWLCETAGGALGDCVCVWKHVCAHTLPHAMQAHVGDPTCTAACVPMCPCVHVRVILRALQCKSGGAWMLQPRGL